MEDSLTFVKKTWVLKSILSKDCLIVQIFSFFSVWFKGYREYVFDKYVEIGKKRMLYDNDPS